MKKHILISMVIGLLFSCSTDDQNNVEAELIGNWKLIEVLADQGDGGGTFQPVESNKIIEFKNDGTITTNNSLCEPYSNEMVRSGSFSNNTITINCQNPNIVTIEYELENQYLILNFISNERYSQKFEKN